MVNIEGFKYFMYFKFMYQEKFITKLFDAVILLNILDAVTTYIGLKFSQSIVEKNQLILSHIESIGLELVMLLKIVFITLLFLFLKILFLKKKFPLNDNKKLDKICISCLYLFVIGVLIYTVVSNTIVIMKSHSIIPMM